MEWGKTQRLALALNNKPQIAIFLLLFCWNFGLRYHDLLADVVGVDEGHKVVGEGHGIAEQ